MNTAMRGRKKGGFSDQFLYAVRTAQRFKAAPAVREMLSESIFFIRANPFDLRKQPIECSSYPGEKLTCRVAGLYQQAVMGPAAPRESRLLNS